MQREKTRHLFAEMLGFFVSLRKISYFVPYVTECSHTCKFYEIFSYYLQKCYKI